MKKVILFSNLTEDNTEEVTSSLFPNALKNKSFAFMPSDGIVNCKQEYVDQWQTIARKFNASFTVIDNLANNTHEEMTKLENANILVISGGNTFKLLDNLRKSGLDKAIGEFAHKDNFVLSGYSAGALVLTPSIEVCNLPKFDINEVGIHDLTGLGIVNFEVFPHFTPDDMSVLEDYRKRTQLDVRSITDNDYIEINNL